MLGEEHAGAAQAEGLPEQGASEAELGLAAAGGFVASDAGLDEGVLKSVVYQPAPLSTKEVLLTNFSRLSAEHCGQELGWESLIFIITS